MTSLAFILGVMPLVFASGAGREARHSVGTAVAGGMIASTFLNLAFIPVLYVVVKSIGRARGDDESAEGVRAPSAARPLASGLPPSRRRLHAQTPPPAERLSFRDAIARAIEKNPSSAIAAAGILRAEALLRQARADTRAAGQRQRHDDDAEHGRRVSRARP